MIFPSAGSGHLDIGVVSIICETIQSVDKTMKCLTYRHKRKGQEESCQNGNDLHICAVSSKSVRQFYQCSLHFIFLLLFSLSLHFFALADLRMLA
jgi:hypothetical protein